MKLRILFILCLSLCCLNAVAVTWQEAKALAAAHDYEKALPAMRDVMQQKKYANNAECNKFYGQCLCMTGNYAESLKYLEIGAKGGFYGAWWYLGISRQHLYDFEGAIDALKKYRARCSESSHWIPRTDSIISECELGLKAVNHVQDVAIIDSLVVPKENFFAHYKLGNESGSIISPTTFENLMQDYRLISKKNDDGSYNLYSSSKFENKWTEPEKIESIGNEKYQILYPFQRTDGVTLYFASDITPGFGGLDIYKTTYNIQTDSYYTPTRLGMPFNSPFDDYMLAIDETNLVGWWATERNANPGYVCIYIFVVNEDPDYLSGENVSRARIDRIADTWNGENYEQLVYQINNPEEKTLTATNVFFIPIRDGKVYTSLDDFKNPQARAAYEDYVRLNDDLTEIKDDLASMRREYAKANSAGKNGLRQQILQKEARANNLREQVLAARKKYVNLENTNIQ